MAVYFLVIFFLLFIFLMMFFILIRNCLLIAKVEHESMYPAIKEGDRVLVLRYWPVKWVRRGNVVLIWPRPDQIHLGQDPKPFGITPYIKRVVGLPGDTIVTSINGLDDYHKQKLKHAYDDNGNKSVYIPKNYFFVQGDYPIGGIDSRTFGPIPYESLLGLVIMRFPG